MLSRKSSLYMTGSRTFVILKGFSLIKFNLLLSNNLDKYYFCVWCFLQKIHFIFFLRVSSQTLFLLINFFIFLLKNIKFYQSFLCNSWISSTIITIYNTISSHFLISNKTSASNPLFIKNRVLPVILYSDILYVSIPTGNNLTQLIYQQLQQHLRYYSSI